MKKKPIFRKILIPIMGLVIIEILILVCTMFGQGLLQELNANEEDVIKGKVSARKNYFESVMVNDWMNVSNTAEYITSTVERLCQTETISLETLDDSSAESAPLFTKISSRLIEMMRTNRVTGAYVIVNTEDLSGTLESGAYVNKPGIYLRDADPTSLASERNEDLLIKLSPKAVVQKLGIATDTSWNIHFDFNEDHREFYEVLYYPFQTAYENEKKYSWQDMGYWSTLNSDEKEEDLLLTYSVPLVLSDNTVVGVLGIELTHEYIHSLLPCDELDEAQKGAYFLAQYSEESGEFTHIFGNGSLNGLIQTENQTFRVDTDRYYYYMESLQIYNSNTPFSNQQWVLVGVVPYESMQEFGKDLVLAVMLAVTAAMIIGIGGSLLISYRFQKPVARLVQEMREKDPRKKVQLVPTGILEIDEMSAAVEHLSRDVIASGRKFSKIIEMASVRLAGFQIDREKNTLFLTEHFFSIFGRRDIDENGMTVPEFEKTMDQLKQYYVEQDTSVGGHIFRIQEDGEQKFIRVRILEDGGSCYGLAEDVTQALLEKKILKHERDHDSLTNLYNRRAFRRKVQELFEKQEDRFGVGAFVMIDLDNLKYINDTYGHEYGDRYIRQAAAALENNLSGDVCYARISGDEFNVFFYGHSNREEIEEQIRNLQEAMNSELIALPDGKLHRVHATGGVAWYPKDSRSFVELSRYADYAMYMVKRTNKGAFGNFDLYQYRSQESLYKSSAALTRMLDNRELYYAFQPIVDARTGAVFAYEALMRPGVPEFDSVKEVMETARREGKLKQIEELTWILAPETFVKYIQEGKISPQTYLFLNSIPNQRMSAQRENEFETKCGKYLNRIVMELTEDEKMDSEIWEGKQSWLTERGGKIALDDYGTGYNSEKTLLSISPDFIKVDIAIVNDIHLNPDKRTIMEYIVNYAHERGKYIIAEGVENREEVETVIALGVDYLQGFFFSRPQKIPEGISEEKRQILLELQQNR